MDTICKLSDLTQFHYDNPIYYKNNISIIHSKSLDIIHATNRPCILISKSKIVYLITKLLDLYVTH